jgi:TolA-binding protein
MKNRIAFALLLASSACWVPVDKGRQMDARIQRLEAESAATTQQIEEQRTVVRDRIARVDQKIVEVQKKLDELNTTAHRSGADVVANQDRMQESLTRQVGQLEEYQHQLQLSDQRLSQLQSETEARFAALKGAGALEDYEGRKRAETLKRPSDKSEFFALAMQQEQSGERAVARQLYDEYVKKWPADPRAADAWFRMGEISFGEKRYREAPTRPPTPSFGRGRPCCRSIFAMTPRPSSRTWRSGTPRPPRPRRPVPGSRKCPRTSSGSRPRSSSPIEVLDCRGRYAQVCGQSRL